MGEATTYRTGYESRPHHHRKPGGLAGDLEAVRVIRPPR